MKLTTQELAIAKEVLVKQPAGKFTLKKMYGDRWSEIVSPTNFGRRFKHSVILGEVPRVTLWDKKSDNHLTYNVQ